MGSRERMFLLGFFFFKIREIPAYLYTDGNDPEGKGELLE